MSRSGRLEPRPAIGLRRGAGKRAANYRAIVVIAALLIWLTL
jgi:hypothetical protein